MSLLTSTDKMHTKIVVASFLAAVAFAIGNVQDVQTNFEQCKAVPSSYSTITSISKIQCVKKCFEEGRKGLCNIAEYNKATRSCKLSWGRQEDLITVANDNAGVYLFPEGKEVLLHAKHCWCLWLNIKFSWHVGH